MKMQSTEIKRLQKLMKIVETSFVYCLAVKDEEVKIIRSNLHCLWSL
jgi:hypothetical protein